MRRREWLIGLGLVPLVATWGFCTSSRAYQAVFWDGHDIQEFQGLFGWGFCDFHAPWWIPAPSTVVYGQSDRSAQFLEAAAFKDGYLYYVNVSC